MTSYWTVELRRHAWEGFREASGPAAQIPSALEEMLTATSADAVKAAYWKLENHVVIQGQLLEVAPHVVSVLIAALLDSSPAFVRIAVLELMFQILSGESHESEPDADLGRKCRQVGRTGLWLLYGELRAELAGQREAAAEVLELLETDKGRVEAMTTALLEQATGEK